MMGMIFSISYLAMISDNNLIQTSSLMQLKDKPPKQAISLLLLGLRQDGIETRSLCCSGLMVEYDQISWSLLQLVLSSDENAIIRAEAIDSVTQQSIIYGWNTIRQSFIKDLSRLVRRVILSVVLQQPQIPARWLMDLSKLAIVDNDRIIRVNGTEIFGRLIRECPDQAKEALEILMRLKGDIDSRVAASATNSLYR
uniref:HEAT repeat-containing PBS lyase n=1 Tax=Paulinella longichromatophora TaxID=1708747 RepID=A0A2H4ZPL0_9EUKA|nr:HEAT repeat-containing PBS lyase [Paulinella longichromatophora]